MNKVHFNIIRNAGRTGSPRLCDSCDYGLVIRGDGEEFAYCSYMRDFVTIRVTDCNRYVATALREVARDGSEMHLLAHYTLD